MSQPSNCQVCGEPTTQPVDMCTECVSAYERQAHDDGAIMEVIVWAAKRARWYAQRRTATSTRNRIETGRKRASRGPHTKQLALFRDACRLLNAVAGTGLELYVTPGSIHLLDGPSHEDTPQARALRENIIDTARVTGISGGDW